MQRSILIFTVLAGILAAPFLCDAGVTAHECHCDSVECCTDAGTACEPDPCDDVYYKNTRQNNDPSVDPAVVVAQHGMVLLSTAVGENTAAGYDSAGSPPVSESDLPQRI